MTGDHWLVTVELKLKHFGAQMGVTSGRQGQSYGILEMVMTKSLLIPRQASGTTSTF